MTGPIRIWLETSHHIAFRVGGWAWVRADGAAVTGQAGGGRRIDAEGAALSGLAAALKAPRGSGSTVLYTATELVAGIPARIRAAQAGETPPADHLDLWALAMTALGTGVVEIVQSAALPGCPSAFAAAWAQLARDRAKDKGPFSLPIPKSNLAKAGVDARGDQTGARA